jgi:CheY-like chemotaxis protein
MNGDKPILLVEDDIVDVMSIKRAMKELSLTAPLIHMNNGEEALEYLKDGSNPRPAIILLDLNMPRMNGIEFLALVKKDAELKILPVVILTTSRADMDKIESFKLGVAGYMIKPVDHQKFVEIMRTISTYWSTSELPG